MGLNFKKVENIYEKLVRLQILLKLIIHYNFYFISIKTVNLIQAKIQQNCYYSILKIPKIEQFYIILRLVVGRYMRGQRMPRTV